MVLRRVLRRTLLSLLFYPNKQITTAEGGMVVTNDDHIADLVRSMRSQGRPITGPVA